MASTPTLCSRGDDGFERLNRTSSRRRLRLRPRQAHDAVTDARPHELAAFQALMRRHEACLIPDQEFYSVRSLRSEHKNRAAKWIKPERLLNDRRQTVVSLAIMCCST